MNSRERYIRALTFQGPDRVPVMHAHLPGALRVHGSRLTDLYARYPGDVLGVPVQEPLTERTAQRSDFAFHDHPRGFGTVGEVTYDDWGCGWLWTTSDWMGRTVVHPLEDWAAFDGYRPPDPMTGVEGVAFVEEMVRRDDHQRFVVVDAGELFQRMWFLRGYENSLIDLMEQPPELFALRDMIAEFYVARIERWLEAGVVDGFIHRDDWGSNTALMADPETWRSVFKPAYKRIADAIHSGGAYASFHSDGYIWEILPDLIEIGWDEVHPQVHLTDIEELGRLYGGKICFRADVDHQWTMPHGSPEDVRALVHRLFEAFGHFNGGYVGCAVLEADVPLANVEAALSTFHSFAYDRAGSP